MSTSVLTTLTEAAPGTEGRSACDPLYEVDPEGAQ